MKQIFPAEGVLSIGVAAHGNLAITEECLRSIFASVAGDFELLLIDDASPDDHLSLFRDAADFHPNTRIYHFPENLEYTQSVNCLLNEAWGERVLFVSNDIFLTPTYVAALLEAMTDPDIGIARGVSNFVDNQLATHNVSERPDSDGWQALLELAAKHYSRNDSGILDDPFLVGDAFMVQRSLLDAIGGFDLGYLGYLSDVDFGLRTVGAGFRRVLCPRAYAWHVRDANFYYLDDAERNRKYARRLERVKVAWHRLREAWAPELLPAEWPGLDQVPFGVIDALARQRGRRIMPKTSYARYMVHPERVGAGDTAI